MDQWTALSLILCAIAEVLMMVIVIRIARQQNARIAYIEETLQEQGFMDRPTLPLSRKTGA